MNRKSTNLFDSKSLHKGIFSKFNYLKQKPNSSSLNKYPRSNIEEYKINQYKENQEDVEANMKKSKHNKGIVFTLPLTAIDSRIFESLEGNYEQRN